jgi:prepilin-type N-terminal cleavage/methylation domain-containing protein
MLHGSCPIAVDHLPPASAPAGPRCIPTAILGRNARRGFTLVELMIVVAIIGLLSAIAIPSFSKYIRKARTAEAISHLSKEWAGSLTYYEADHMIANGTLLTKEFPGPVAAWESDPECGCIQGGACAGGSSVWNSDPVWLALTFSFPDPHHYMPGYTGSGTGTSAQFTAYSKGDLNCNGKLAEFFRSGAITAQGNVSGDHIPVIVNELE